MLPYYYLPVLHTLTPPFFLILQKIWPNQCRVEMYGSCATQLDLPSSDLDLVVCGLDDVVVDHILPSPSPIIDQQSNMSSSLHNSSSVNSISEQAQQQQQQALPQEFIPMSPPVHQQQCLQVPPNTPAIVMDSQQQQQMTAPSSGESILQEGGEPSAALSESFVEGDNSGMMLNESYSPVPSSAEKYSEYNDSSHQGQVDTSNMTDSHFSPGYSYHSQQDISTDNNYLQPAYSQGGEGGMVGQEGGYGQEYQTQNGQEYYYASPYSYASTLSLNAQRVLRLASELELQPWAVQVKAIPTATVPVVKMLADSSKIPGLVGVGGSWMQQQHGGAGELPPPPLCSSDQMAPSNQQGSFLSPHPMTPQWRGADIMNGLQPVDITFEGPEHGGIGSTTYSARVVQDACNETGLPPESTPVVQVASVLKELLAQRRLNEPFSGGLSSYGLLLLLLAVLKDRKIMQEDLEKIERQRQKVSGESSTTRPPQKQRESSSGSGDKSSDDGRTPTTLVSATSQSGVDSSDKSSAAPSANSKPTVSSSWASIAKKSNDSTAKTESMSTVTKSTSGSATTRTAKTGTQKDKEGKNKQQQKKSNDKQLPSKKKKKKSDGGETKDQPAEASSEKKQQTLPQSSNVALDDPQQSAALSQVTPSEGDDRKLSTVPQGSNDVLEVLCSGELTSGKLLMHFLLFYGQHFDSRTTIIDINATHHPEYGMVDFSRLSPFVPRPPGGTIDPVTGMFSVDPIVVYDPLEGAEAEYNVSKRCYCWNNVKWVFAQSYMTVSSIVETSDTTRSKSCSSIQSNTNNHSRENSRSKSFHEGDKGTDKPTSSVNNAKPTKEKTSTTAASDDDVMSGILELLLSF